MKHDATKLRQIRESMGMTQDKLAILSNVSERTVQRAEAGANMRLDTLSDFAAALEIPLSELVLSPDDFDSSSDVSLKRARSGRTLMDDLAKAGVASFDCEVDPDPSELDALLEMVRILEGVLPQPWELHQRPANVSLSQKISLAANIGKLIGALGDRQIGLYASASWISARYPRYDVDEGHRYTKDSQRYEKVQTLQLILCRSADDKIYRAAPDSWDRLDIEPPLLPVDADLDDDVPF